MSVALLAYLSILAAVTGCDRTPDTPKIGNPPAPGDLIVLIGPPRSDPRSPGIAGGVRSSLAQYPTLRLETSTPSDSSADALLRAADRALAMSARAVCLYVGDPAVARPAAERIASSGTILVTMGERCDRVGTFGHVQVDLAGGAELLGKHLAEIAGSKRAYLLVHNQGASDPETHRYERFMQHARRQYQMTLLEERNASETEQPAAELLRAMFRRFRHAGLAVTLNPRPWLESKPAELLGRDARFATLGAAPPLWPALRSGEAAALVGPLDGEIGSLAAELALTGLTESRKAGLLRIVSCELVTPDTLDDFAQRYAAAGIDLSELRAAGPASRPAATSPPDMQP
jgi:ABC-type sugar transport system substrate-binding protein